MTVDCFETPNARVFHLNATNHVCVRVPTSFFWPFSARPYHSAFFLWVLEIVEEQNRMIRVFALFTPVIVISIVVIVIAVTNIVASLALSRQLKASRRRDSVAAAAVVVVVVFVVVVEGKDRKNKRRKRDNVKKAMERIDEEANAAG